MERSAVSRWLVGLQGDEVDLAEYPRWFHDGEVNAVREAEGTYLTGPAFESLADAQQVWMRAIEVVERLFMVVSAIVGTGAKPSIGPVIREDDNGRRSGAVFGIGTARSTSRAVGVSSGPAATGTSAEQMFATVNGSVQLHSAARLWSTPHRSWPHLYIIYEELVDYLGQEPDAAGLCTTPTRELFMQSAQPWRHGTRKHRPPKNPMNLEEATRFILDLLNKVLRM